MLVFFYLADYEILELSEAKLNPSRILAVLNLELRLLVLLTAMDDCVVLSPSHYREEEICRELVKLNRPFIDDGWLGLVMREVTLQDNKAKQAKRYEDYGHLEKYHLAYLLRTDYGLSKLGFRILSKDFKTGRMSIDVWERKVRAVAIRVDYPTPRLEELIRRVRGSEEAPFIWERVKAILDLMNFGPDEEKLLRIRASMSTSYIESHRLGGISLPRGSMAIREVILPQIGRDNAYDLMRFRRVLQQAEVFYSIASFGPEKILALKAKTSHIMDKIRKGNKNGNSSEQIFTDLRRTGLISELQKAVKGIDSCHVPRNKTKMPIYRVLSDVEAFLKAQTQAIEKLTKRFIQYQHPEGKAIDNEEVKLFLRQFETLERVSLAFVLLQNVTFIDRVKMREMFRHYCEQILSVKEKEKTILTNLGGPYDSSRIVSYVCADIAMEIKLKAQDLRAILDQEDFTGKTILFVDDNIGSGKQAIDTFRELLGLTEEKELKESHEIELTDSQRSKLKKFKLSLFTFVGFEEGKKDFTKKLRKLELNMAEPYSFLKQEERVGCFHPTSDIFESPKDRKACELICSEIGYQLFADKTDWSDGLKRERSLGYGNSQKMTVFFYNVPTSTLPILWKRGTYNNKKWEPLFPRREKNITLPVKQLKN